MVKKSSWLKPVKMAYQSPNPIIRMVQDKEREEKLKKAGRKPVMIEVRKTKKPARMKQYGDPGYRPSTGSGVSY